MPNTEPRGEIRTYEPTREGWGSRRAWNRMLGGKLYSFHIVTMPDGERRYGASRWDGGGRPGEPGHPNFACDWTIVFTYTVPVYHATQSERFPRLWHVHTYRERHSGQFDTGTIYRTGADNYRTGEDTFRATRDGEGREGTPDGLDRELGSADTLDGALALFQTPWH